MAWLLVGVLLEEGREHESHATFGDAAVLHRVEHRQRYVDLPATSGHATELTNVRSDQLAFDGSQSVNDVGVFRHELGTEESLVHGASTSAMEDLLRSVGDCGHVLIDVCLIVRSHTLVSAQHDETVVPGYFVDVYG